jgi:hypothetical protein
LIKEEEKIENGNNEKKENKEENKEDKKKFNFKESLFNKVKKDNEEKLKKENEERKRLEDLNIKLDVKVEYTQNKKTAKIRYIGKIKNENDKSNIDLFYIGIEWDEEGVGKNDGMVFGLRYFQTKPKTASIIDVPTFEKNFNILN